MLVAWWCQTQGKHHSSQQSGSNSEQLALPSITATDALQRQGVFLQGLISWWVDWNGSPTKYGWSWLTSPTSTWYHSSHGLFEQKNPPFSVAFFPGWPPALRGKKWFTFHEQPLSGESRLALETLQRSGAFATLHAAVAYLQVKVRIGKDGSMKLEVVVCEWCKMWGTFPKTTVKRVFPNLEVAGWSLTEACDSSTFCAGSASFLLGGFETARIWVDFLCLNMSNLWSHFDFKGFPWEAPLRTTLWSWSRGLTLCCCSAEGGNRKSQWLICRRVLFVQKM